MERRRRQIELNTIDFEVLTWMFDNLVGGTNASTKNNHNHGECSGPCEHQQHAGSEQIATFVGRNLITHMETDLLNVSGSSVAQAS